MLKENNCVLVVGHSGNGKSAIIRHIALKHFNEDGYDIIPTGVAPTTILKYHNPERNQIFVIDDFCGKEVLNPQHVEIWSLHMDNILKLIINNQEHKEQTGKGNIKLLFATASDIFKDSLFIRMGCLSKFKFSLSEQPLQDQEKLCMIEKYVTQEKITDIITSSLKSHKDIYPLLCKLSVGKSQEQIVQLFTNPNEVIRQDFLELKNTNKTQICLIAICILLESLKDDMFREENIPVEDIEVIEAVCSEFDLDLCKESTRTELNEELKYLGKTYFVKVCESYQLMHQIIFDIAAVFCGKMMISNIFIRFAHSSYIAERYSFMSCDEEKIDNLIFIHNEEAQKIYFDRLLSDLKKGITYSTFHNRQLIHKLYRDKFCKYCRERKDEVVEILNNLKKNIKYSREDTNEKTTAISEENVNEYGDYMMFSKSYHFSSHKMRIPLIESVWEGNEDIVDLLVELKRNVNETDKFGRSALFVACQRGEENIAIYLLKKGAKHELAEHNEISPLIAACKGGYIRTMNALLNKGADIFKSDKNGCCSLHAASKGGHIKIVKQLLNAEIIVDINQDDIFGRSALFVASYHGKKRVVKFLIEKKARIDQCDKQGISPLLAACTQGRYDVVEILISSDADIFKTDTDRRSALHFACKDGQLTIVEKLLQIGADVKETDRQQRSPLFIASSFGHEQIVRHLVGKHFGLSIIKQSDEEGKSPLFIACEKGHESIVDILLDTTSSEIIEQTDKRQRTPLYVACSGGFLEIVKLLVHKGAQIDNVNICQATPLSTACKEGHIEVVQYLIQKHANLNLADSNGQTPLSVACDEGNAAVVRILVDHGSNIHHKDNDNRTPLQIAQMREHTDIENILKQ
ncbi:ankyrin repeat and KH domain-containing protein 1-like [Mytilus trossulus]|uniref:ankyrin repeat and KH domain-containing protein 1-like n=1 Tax=Mytilus trossulus TaxID=6551 RepID=UPI003003BF71